MSSPIITLLDPNNNVAFQVDGSGNASVKGNLSVTGSVGGGANAGLLTKTVTLTATQLLALKTTPVQIIAAPGAGLAIDVLSISLKYKFVTTAYTLNSGTFKLFYGPVANAHALCADQSASFLTAAANRNIIGIPALVAATDTDTNNVNVAINAGNDGTNNYTLGDATVDVVVLYSIITP